MSDFFKSTQYRHRIFLSGIAGSGKTALLNKIVFDWASKEKCVHKFNFIFYIELSKLSKGESIFDYCSRNYFGNYMIKEEHFEKFLEDQNALLIFDGYDELHMGNEQVNEVLEGRQYRDCSYVCSSRPGKMIKGNKFHVTYTICAISDTDVSNFFETFEKINKKVTVSFKDHPLTSLLTVPIFIWFHAIISLYLPDEKTDNMKTRSDYYGCIIRALKNKYVIRSGLEANTVEEQLEQISAKAFECLCGNKQYFEINDKDKGDLSWLVDFGIVSKLSMLRSLESGYIYKFTHRTIMEYLAARYVRDDPDNIDENVRKIEATGTSWFHYFVCGQLEEPSQKKQMFEILKDIKPKDEPLYILECVAESNFFEGLNECAGFFPNDVSLDTRYNLLYIQMGLYILLSKCDQYKLNALSIDCDGVDVKNKLRILIQLLRKNEK